MNVGPSVQGNGEKIVSLNSKRQSLPRQVTILVFSTEHLPSSLISEEIARSLYAETNTSVVLVRLEPQPSHQAAQGEPFLNGEFHMPLRFNPTEAGFYQLTLGVRSEPPSAAGIASLINQLSCRFRHVLIEVQSPAAPAPWLFEFLIRADLAFLFFAAASKDSSHLDLIIREARSRCKTPGFQIKPIACLSEGEQIEDPGLLAQGPANPIHMFVRSCPSLHASANPTGSFRADLRRLAREVGGCLLGVALSSGAAKGFAHIGVIQVLEENGIEVDVIAGASMGAYVGALWSFGNDGHELERLAREMERRWSLWTLVDPVFPPRRGLMRGFAIKQRLMRSIANAHFADLPRPLRIVAANLATLERVVFASGQVATAVHASIAVPGICVPITIDGETYIDGGIVDPLPVDVLREMGVSRVIAVDVIPTPERIRHGLDQPRNYFARLNLVEVLMRSVYGAQIRMAESASKRADLVLRPDISDDRWLDVRHPGKFIGLGRAVAERRMDEIKALVAKQKVIYEPELAPESVATFA